MHPETRRHGDTHCPCTGANGICAWGMPQPKKSEAKQEKSKASDEQNTKSIKIPLPQGVFFLSLLLSVPSSHHSLPPLPPLPPLPSFIFVFLSHLHLFLSLLIISSYGFPEVFHIFYLISSPSFSTQLCANWCRSSETRSRASRRCAGSSRSRTDDAVKTFLCFSSNCSRNHIKWIK